MMLTRCPACNTTFRIRPDQAKARQGKVRCGECRHVFNAIDFLVDAAPPATPAKKPDTPPKTAPRITAPAADNDFVEDFSVLGDVAPSSRYKKQRGVKAAPSPLSDDYFTDDESMIRAPVRWPWIVGGLLTIIALTGQIAVAWRVDLATRYPELREPLTLLCEPFECTVGLPLNASLLKIESSDLHPSTQKKGRLELKGTLKNHAPYTQAWPHLELTLTDSSDRLVARRALAPDVFISSPEVRAAGFPADSEFAVQVQFDVGDLPASGYRLYIFYP